MLFEMFRAVLEAADRAGVLPQHVNVVDGWGGKVHVTAPELWRLSGVLDRPAGLVDVYGDVSTWEVAAEGVTFRTTAHAAALSADQREQVALWVRR